VLSLIFGFTIVVMWLGSEVSEIFRSGRRRRALLFIRPIINHPAAEKKMPA
jgi:predicted RNA-binding protein